MGNYISGRQAVENLVKTTLSKRRLKLMDIDDIDNRSHRWRSKISISLLGIESCVIVKLLIRYEHNTIRDERSIVLNTKKDVLWVRVRIVSNLH